MGFKYLNPYYYVGAAVVMAAIIGGFYFQSRQIHHWHNQYNTEHDRVISLQEQIKFMTVSQQNQTDVSTKTVEKVVKIPVETAPIIKTIHDTPSQSDCTPPQYPEDVLNAF